MHQENETLKKRGCCHCPCCHPDQLSDDVFASFANFAAIFTSGSRIGLFPVVTDPTGQIERNDENQIQLAAGYYLISYKVSVVFDDRNYMQITPSYNGAPHLEYGIYFQTGDGRGSAAGSAHLILHAPEDTLFSLNYNGSATGYEGSVNVTIVKLNREETDAS